MYRLETTSIQRKYLQEFDRLIWNTMSSVAGLPPRLSPKTIYSNRRAGLGLIPVQYRMPARWLDTAQRALARLTSLTAARTVDTLATQFNANRPAMYTDLANADLIPPAIYLKREAPHPDSHCFTDGSFDGTRAASAFYNGNGDIYVCPLWAKKSSFNAEVTAIAMAARIAPRFSVIHTDCKAALATLTSSSHPKKSGLLVARTRQEIADKRVSLKWVKAHSGHMFNEQADLAAKSALNAPPPPPPTKGPHWALVVNGSLTGPPNYEWLSSLVPRHRQQDIHSISWMPLTSYRPEQWAKWLFGCINGTGYRDYHEYWFDRKRRCPNCRQEHSLTANGSVGYCGPLHEAWVTSWTKLGVSKLCPTIPCPSQAQNGSVYLRRTTGITSVAECGNSQS